MLINLLEIKQLVNQVISKLQDEIEVSGMEGDTGYAEYIQSELDTMTKVKTELEGYRNSSLSIPFLLSSLREATPSLDLNYLIRELENLITVKEQQLKEFERVLDLDKVLLEKLKHSVIDPQDLPTTRR